MNIKELKREFKALGVSFIDKGNCVVITDAAHLVPLGAYLQDRLKTDFDHKGFLLSQEGNVCRVGWGICQKPFLKRVLVYLKRRFFCKHKMKFVEGSKWSLHLKCEKCGYEWGAGKFMVK